MGMFDTVHFAEPVACAICQAPIPSTQTKAFDRLAVERFLHDLVRWYDEGYDQMTPEERVEKHRPFFLNKDTLEGASDPVTALRVYLERHSTADEA